MKNRKKMWTRIFHSFEEAEVAEQEYYRKMTPAERIRTVQMLREAWFKISGGKNGRRPKRLSRIVKIIQPA